MIGSTPTFEDSSHILRAYAASDQRIYECPCPHCGAFLILWRHIEWPEGSNGEGAACRCPHCHELIEERFRFQMVEAGHWRAQRPEIKDHVGFKLSALISPLEKASWSNLAKEFLTAKDDPTELQVFVNTVLAEGRTSQGSELDEGALARRAEDISLDKIPVDVLALTCGVDVQDDRLECSIVGWTREDVAIALHHEVLWGSFTDPNSWLDLDKLLSSTWRHPYGGALKIDAACVDAGDGYHFAQVLALCEPRMRKRIFASRGASGSRPPFQLSKGCRSATSKLAILGVDGLKSVIFDRLSRSGSMIRFSNTLEPSYYDQLASERRIVRYRRGQPVRIWERIPDKRAEALDALVYAIAARRAVPIVFASRIDELRGEVMPPKLPKVIPSRWMNR